MDISDILLLMVVISYVLLVGIALHSVWKHSKKTYKEKTMLIIFIIIFPPGVFLYLLCDSDVHPTIRLLTTVLIALIVFKFFAAYPARPSLLYATGKWRW